MAIVPELTRPGQESVWSFPRSAIAEPCNRRIVIRHRGETVADTTAAVRVIETSHPPTYYLPPGTAHARLLPSAYRSICEWKGAASYVGLVIGSETLRRVG